MDVDAVLRRARGPLADYFVVGQSSKPNTFAFKTVGRGPKLGVDIDAPYIVWHPQHVEITANEAMQAGNGTAKREAREFLLDRLEAGPVNSDDLVEEAKQEGIAFATLRRAKKDLGIKSRKQRGAVAGAWTWELPHKELPHKKTPATP